MMTGMHVEKIGKYANWKIPTNLVKLQQQGRNIIRSRPSEIIHPFYKIGPLEQLLLNYRYKTSSLLDGRPNFATFDRDSQKYIPKQLKLRSTPDLPEWVHNYSFHVHNNVFKDISSMIRITEKDIKNQIRESYITKDTSANIETIETLMAKNSKMKEPFEPLNLVSLIDGVVMTTDGVYTEDLYTFVIQKHCNHLNNITLTVNAIMLHMETMKLDQFFVLEKLLSQLVYTMRPQMELVARVESNIVLKKLDDLIQAIRMKFPNQIFQGTTNTQLMDLYTNVSYTITAHEYLKKLILVNNMLPEEQLVAEYIAMLTDCFHDDTTSKMGYISDLSSVIESQMTSKMLHFTLPLCSHFNEIQRLLQIVTKKKETYHLMDKESLIAMLRQIEIVDDNDLSKGIDIIKIYNILLEHNMVSEQYVPIFVEFLARCGNFTMIANLIECKTFSLSNSPELLKKIIANIKEDRDENLHVYTRKSSMFLSQYILPIIDKVELSDELRTALKTL
ncbi:similar to Saccharomyces cerevisiae YMR064W AEP1 Protein required for expression of the mitochondrial OLI1 gene encoding subunit 9 of F1-F0 ATP synthase [Maudiozyma saulgeensis]|uniref:ATPase expression protein 1 n=1 Tax=Maudiozyma saulgeensis TaxID=1789683 RepID=A0A1X7RAB6_9SACH|nr:similar to Saccharomyces cerevisiae YMR064W AEP1 Protein required for expression of the mitochondrial OLI1 gene encoding subunit 9 of F1-F0 ATP synthase [Kazachstania saulgeensis]